VLTLPKPVDFGDALSTLFRELGTEWLSAAPQPRVVTDERVLRELSLPPDAETRLCYLTLPVRFVSMYRELVFPFVDEVGLVPATGDEVSGPESNIRAMLESLLQRAFVVIGDVSTGDPRVLREIHAAAQRERAPFIAVITDEGRGSEASIPKIAERFVRPTSWATDGDATAEREDVEAYGWLEQVRSWLSEVAVGALRRLDEEALRLLDQGMFRAAVIAASSAVEVALTDLLESPESGFRQSLGYRRTASPTRLLTTAMLNSVITEPEYDDLRELQRTRNFLVHTAASIDGRKARGHVQRAAKVVKRLRETYAG
jgi:hypothetical protein